MTQIRLATLVAAVVGFIATAASAEKDQTGNGAPSGAHYNLNIIGVENPKTADMTGSDGHVIFVSLGRTQTVSTKIYLQQGPFQVIDANGTDGVAKFQLPQNNVNCPPDGSDPNCDAFGSSTYSVFVRALGQPGGSATITTCRESTLDPTIMECSTETVSLMVETGKNTKQFTNVTKELTTLCLDTDLNLVCDTRIQLFSDDAFQYFWDYDNHGLRLLQLRFYPRP